MDLISKKDLLALTGISYGQLYRWKRERLIPEDWFIKQSSYTGQETFFPREQILSRVRTIQEAKGDHSLEELAALFSPQHAAPDLSSDKLSQLSEISPSLLGAISSVYGKECYDFFDVVLFAALSRALEGEILTPAEAVSALRASITASVRSPRATALSLTLFTSGDVFHAVLTHQASPLWFDGGAEVRFTCDLGELSNQMKLKYNALTGRKEAASHES